MQQRPGSKSHSSLFALRGLSRESLLRLLERHLVRVVVFGCLAAIAGSVALTLRHLQSLTAPPTSQTVPQKTEDSSIDRAKLHQTKTSLEELNLSEIIDPFQRLEP